MTNEELKALAIDHLSKSEEEINNMFNLGRFNDIVRGYFVLTLKDHNMSDPEIQEILKSLYRVLDLKNAGEAKQAYKAFCES